MIRFWLSNQEAREYYETNSLLWALDIFSFFGLGFLLFTTLLLHNVSGNVGTVFLLWEDHDLHTPCPSRLIRLGDYLGVLVGAFWFGLRGTRV